MIINSLTLYKTPFDNTYTDVLDVFDYSNKTESQITNSIKNFIDNNFTKSSFSVSGTRAENIDDFTIKVIFTSDSSFESVRDYNYCILKDRGNNSKFYFISSIKELNSIYENNSSRITFQMILNLDIWNTYYPKLVKNANVNLFSKISKKHQKIGTKGASAIDVNSNYILDVNEKTINTKRTYTSSMKILWLKIVLKKPTSSNGYGIYESYDVNGNIYTHTGEYYEQTLVPFNENPEIYFPVAYALEENEDSPFELVPVSNTNRPVLMKVVESGVEHDFMVESAETILKYADGAYEYVDSMELTFLAPIVVSDIQPNKVYVTGSAIPRVVDVLGTSLKLTQSFVVTANKFSLEQGITGTDTLLSAFFNYNVSDILTKDNIYNCSVCLHTYPYKKRGWSFDNQYYDFAKEYYGNAYDEFIIKINKFADGYKLSFQLKNNNKIYQDKKYQFSLHSHREILPVTSNEKDAYLIANSNTISEEYRHAEIMKYLQIIGSIAAGTAGATAAGMSGNIPVAIGAVAAAGISVGKSIENYTHFSEGVLAKISDLANLPSKINSNGNGGYNSSSIIGKLCSYTDEIIKDKYSENIAIDEYVSGTFVNIIDNPFYNVREKYDYVATENIDIKCSYFNKNALRILSTILNNGVRKWHSDKSNISLELNPYIRNFDADWYV